MKKLSNEQELKELVSMAKDFEAQIHQQCEIARKIAMNCEKVVKAKKNKHKA